MADDFEVLMGVGVLGVTEDDVTLLVDLFGSELNVCGTVRLSIADDDRRAVARAQIQRWSREDTPLSLVTKDDTVRLVDEAAAFEAVLDLPPS